MEIINNPSQQLREPKQVGGYLVIKNPTPEVKSLLKLMNDFRFDDDRINFKMIAKPAQRFEDLDGYESEDMYASIGWKVTIKDRTMTLEDRVKEIQ